MESSKWKLGISPINWVNEDVLELGDHYTCEQLLHDFEKLGFKGTENCRKFPKDPQVLKATLAAKGIQLTSEWKGVLFSDPDYREQEMDAYRRHAEFLSEMGCKHIVTCELGGSIIGDPRRAQGETEVIPLTDRQWGHMVEGLNRAGEICKERGMKLVYHYHIGTVVEKPEEIDRLMRSSDPELVYLLFDTGHAVYGGADPLALLSEYAGRIPYVHLKDVRGSVLERVKRSYIPFQQSVIEGVFTVPGDGAIDFKPIIGKLQEIGYDGWMIIEAEQDPSVAEPNQYAEKCLRYLSSI
ncbi:myo-inosose-2 dehydratase [Cohnella herbarum]|uniref:Myo-inosose-2 dehydratase n=1 Tax=Cohnella herbarum TaxID=2728023 RepID=A0A7Z2VQH9_9BACL|nr:myo-inosose-2 dehydratase [Cohnella herbarum]QJD87265.1 myo-inosose-2 dehydratase [Cohnella herbarum]